MYAWWKVIESRVCNIWSPHWGRRFESWRFIYRLSLWDFNTYFFIMDNFLNQCPDAKFTLEQAQLRFSFTFEYSGWWYSYEDSDWEHLIIQWKEVARWKNTYQWLEYTWDVESQWKTTLYHEWDVVATWVDIDYHSEWLFDIVLESWEKQRVNIYDRSTWQHNT